MRYARTLIRLVQTGVRPIIRRFALAAVPLTLFVPVVQAAQTPDPPPEEWDSISDALRGHEWADQINNLIDVARAMPDSLYAYTPVEPLMTFGGVVAHIADIQFWFCDMISGRTGPERPTLPETAGKDATLRFLMDAIATCDRVFDALTDEQLVANRARVADNLTTKMGHTRRETGRLVTYLRLVGIVPPEIKFYQGRTWRNNN